jgi:hypothetical protein
MYSENEKNDKVEVGKIYTMYIIVIFETRTKGRNSSCFFIKLRFIMQLHVHQCQYNAQK